MKNFKCYFFCIVMLCIFVETSAQGNVKPIEFTTSELKILQDIGFAGNLKSCKKMMKAKDFKISKDEKSGNNLHVLVFEKEYWGWYAAYYNDDDELVVASAGVSPQYMYNDFKRDINKSGLYQTPNKDIKGDDGTVHETFTYANRNFPLQFIADYTDYSLMMVTKLSTFYTTRF